jgi:pentatricopeptide repeat protein
VQCALGGEGAAAADVSAAAAAAASDFFLSSAPADCASPADASPRGPAFSYFSSASPPPSLGAPGPPARAAWTAENAAVRGLSLDLPSAAAAEEAAAAAASVHATGAAPERGGAAAGAAAAAAAARVRGALNEVVCGALMLAYERAGRWRECVAVLGRARALGLAPNTVMFNTALSALGKAGEARAAAALFAALPAPDAVSHETLVAAHGVAGDAAAAEAALAAMRAAGHAPRDYAWCGLVAAHSLAGDWRAALRVRERAAAEAAGAPGTDGAPAAAVAVPSVHLFNALLAAADRARQYERAVSLWAEMRAAGVAPNAATRALLEGVARGGVRAVEGQQAAVAALTAAVAAAGTVMIRAGVF